MLLKTVQPESVGFSSERLTRIDSVFKEYVDKGLCAGASALIARNSGIVYYKAIGYDDIETKSPLKEDAIFRIASQTKAVTSVAIMMLYESGKILLDDPVSKYLPEFKNIKVLDKFNEADSTYTTVDPKRPVTIRDLLTHTSGIGYPFIGTKAMNVLYAKNKIVSAITTDKVLLKDEMKKLANVPLGHQPGEKFTYGLSVDLLGYIIEVVSGVSLDEYLQTNIFKPLGMNDTYFYLPKDKYNRLANLYGLDSVNHLIKLKPSNGFNPDYPKSEGTYFAGGGGLSSTSYDYAVFLQMLVNDGVYNGKRFLSQSTIKMMRTNQIGDILSGSLFIPNSGGKFGLGFEVIAAPGSIQVPMSEGSYGWGGTFGSLYWVDPKEKIVAQLVLQLASDSYNDLRKKFVALVYQAIAE
jgi:CubicO group peptidase (beta-lactamase class C family)